MKFNLIVLVLIAEFAISSSAVAQSDKLVREKIIPLYSTKVDVERIWRATSFNGRMSRYETPTEYFEILYSDGNCSRNGWDVPVDTVIELKIFPKSNVDVASVLNSTGKTVETSDDTGNRYIGDSERGVEVSLLPGSIYVHSIKIAGKMADSKLRCSGFPPFDIVADKYEVYESSMVENSDDWDSSTLMSTIASVRENKELKAYIFVYTEKDGKVSCRTLIDKIRKLSTAVLGSTSTSVVIEFGGVRDHAGVETFLIPRHYPRALPRPTSSRP